MHIHIYICSDICMHIYNIMLYIYICNIIYVWMDGCYMYIFIYIGGEEAAGAGRGAGACFTTTKLLSYTKVQILTADTYFTGCVAGGVPRLQN